MEYVISAWVYLLAGAVLLRRALQAVHLDRRCVVNLDLEDLIPLIGSGQGDRTLSPGWQGNHLKSVLIGRRVVETVGVASLTEG